MPRYILDGEIRPQLAEENLEAVEIARLNDFKANGNNTNSHDEAFTDVLTPPKTGSKSAVVNTKENIISHRDARTMIGKFDNDNGIYILPYQLLLDFITDSTLMARRFRNGTYQLAFRIYIGHDGNPDDRSRVYNLVIVPVCTLLTPDGKVIHSEDKERTLFDETNTNFFALVLSQVDNVRISRGFGRIEECKALLANKDDVGTNPTLVIYHTYKDLHTFQIGLDITKTVEAVEIKFARTIDTEPTKNDRLAIILEFSNDTTGPVSSTINNAGNSITGICFDRGDLLPPPPLVDSLFIP